MIEYDEEGHRKFVRFLGTILIVGSISLLVIGFILGALIF